MTDVHPKFLEKSPRYRGWPMYTLSSWRSHLGIVAVVLSHQEYPSVMLDPRAINKLAEFVSPRFRSESAQNSPGIRPAYPDFRPESTRYPLGIRSIIFNGDSLRIKNILFKQTDMLRNEHRSHKDRCHWYSRHPHQMQITAVTSPSEMCCGTPWQAGV